VPVRFSDANLEVTQLRIFAFSNTSLTAVRILNAGSITMRNAQIAVTFPSTAATGISNEGVARLTVENSSVAIGENGSGLAIGITASGGSTVTVRNTSVTCSLNGPPDVGCVRGSGAGTRVNILHSSIQANGAPNETVVAAASATVTARFSELLDGLTLNEGGAGTLTCYGVINPSYDTDFHGNTCFPD
jgi:hypothetical protein